MIDANDILLLASHTGLLQDVELALSKGADVNSRHIQGLSVLHLAAISNHPIIVRRLVARGARIDEIDPSGRTPFQLAIDRCAFLSALELAHLGCNTEQAWGPSGETALHRLARTEQWNLVAEILIAGADPDARSPSGSTAAQEAARHSQSRVLRTLMIGGADISLISTEGVTGEVEVMVNAWRASRLALEAHG